MSVLVLVHVHMFLFADSSYTLQGSNKVDSLCFEGCVLRKAETEVKVCLHKNIPLLKGGKGG